MEHKIDSVETTMNSSALSATTEATELVANSAQTCHGTMASHARRPSTSTSTPCSPEVVELEPTDMNSQNDGEHVSALSDMNFSTPTMHTDTRSPEGGGGGGGSGGSNSRNRDNDELSPVVELPQELLAPKKLTNFQSSAIIANTISVGYILLPATFAQGGTLLTTVCLTAVAFASYVSGSFILESCARAEASMNVSTLRSQRPSVFGRYSCAIRDRKFEISELCRLFLGRHGQIFFTITTMLDLYGLTWTLSAVFAASLADGLPISDNATTDYRLYVLIFMAIAVPMSCLQISSQLMAQMVFLSARLFMVALMLGTTAAAYVSPVSHFGTQVGPEQDVGLGNPKELIQAMVTCVFATAFQFAIPGLTAETQNKKAMHSIMRWAVSFVYTSNLILSLVLAIFFGLGTNSSSNLNWVDYHGGTWNGEGKASDDENRAMWATLISRYIVLFAAIDGLIVFPLNAISLGEIMMGAIYGENIHDVEKNWKIRTVFRLLASVPQAVGSIFLSDLNIISMFGGVFTLLSYTVAPCLLNILSHRQMKSEFAGRSQTYYQTHFSSPFWSWVLMIVSVALAVGVIVEASFRMVIDQGELDLDSGTEG